MSALATAVLDRPIETAGWPVADVALESEESEIKLLAFELWSAACSDTRPKDWVSDTEALFCRASCL